MRGLNAKGLAVYRVNKLWKKNYNNWNFISLFLFLYLTSSTPCILIYLYIKIPLMIWSHPATDHLTISFLPINSLPCLDMCNQFYSVLLINFGPTTQNNQPWLGGSKLHSNLWLLIFNISCFVGQIYVKFKSNHYWIRAHSAEIPKCVIFYLFYYF